MDRTDQADLLHQVEQMSRVDDEGPGARLVRLAATGRITDWNAWRQRHLADAIGLRGIDLRGASLQGVDLHGADLRDAHLTGADLRDANLRGVDLRGATLEQADLRGATLTKARLRGASFAHADLRGVLWDLRASLRAWPSGWVLLALLTGGAVPVALFLAGLATFASATMPTLDRILLGLEVFVFLPLGMFFLWCIVRFLLMVPFDLFLILKMAALRVRQRDGCMAIIQTPMLLMVLLVDAVNPLPFLDTFSNVMAEELSHGDALLTMRVKALLGYLALLLLDAWALAQWLQYDPVGHLVGGR
jgi:hypothetical protein